MTNNQQPYLIVLTYLNIFDTLFILEYRYNRRKIFKYVEDDMYYQIEFK